MSKCTNEWFWMKDKANSKFMNRSELIRSVVTHELINISTISAVVIKFPRFWVSYKDDSIILSSVVSSAVDAKCSLKAALIREHVDHDDGISHRHDNRHPNNRSF